jgi:hypothetical protein
VSEWVKEKGPPCFCGCPTWVEPDLGGEATLICIFHTKEAGASFPLPSARPENWPNLTQDELHACMERGYQEADARGDDDD